MTKTDDKYEAANPKHCGYALTFVNNIHHSRTIQQAEAK